MGSLFIAGNGFDIAHGISSSYGDFRKFLIKRFPEALEYRDKIIFVEDCENIDVQEFAAEILISTMDKVSGINWSNFEEALAHIDFNDKLPKPNHKEDETDEEDRALMNNIAYYRYVDDILILVNREAFLEVKDAIERDICELDLELNSKKDEGEIINGFEYLGYRISDESVSVRQSSILKIEQSIEDLFREITKGNVKYIQWKLNLKITGFILEEHKYGWLFFYSQITDMKLLFHLDDVVKKLVKRYGLEEKIRVKRFVRTYAEMRLALHETKYIPNLDNITLEEKKKLLTEI